MGQYFKTALINNEGHVKVVNLNWRKLMEHSRYGNNSMMRVEKLLYRNWMNVYRIWDYSIMSAMVWKHKFEDEEEKLWSSEWEAYGEEDILQRKEGDNYYLVNHFSKEFINMTKQENNKDLQNDWWWVVHPLPLLTEAETETAWWWYYSDIGREYIGKWCWDVISIYHWEDWIELEDNLKDMWFEDMTDVYFFKE